MSPRVLLGPETASRWVGVFTLLFSGFFLSVWLFFPQMKEFAGVSMKFNSALCLFLCSLSLILLAEKPLGICRRALGTAVSAAVILFSGLIFFQYLSGISIGIDEWLVRDFRNDESILFPGRIAPNTAVGYFLAGVALLVLGRTRTGESKFPLRTLIGALLGLICLFTFLGYLYHVPALYRVSNYLRMSPYTATGLALLALGIVFAPPRERPIQLLIGTTLGGVTARRLLGTALLLPMFLGWVRLEGQRASWYDLEIGTVILVVSFSVVYAIMILKTAASLNKIDEEQKQAREQLAAAVRARDEFLSIASHELKTPLTALKLQSQIRERQVNRNDLSALNPDSFKELCRSDAKQVERLVRLVDDMLDIGRLSTGSLSMRIAKFDFGDMVREVSERLRPQFVPAGSTLLVECRGNLVGEWDRERMEQVMMNLLTNALKYGDAKPVRVDVTESGDCVRVQVKDKGIGIAPENQARIFNRFERAVGPSVIGGMGLGLYITKQIIVAHRGTIQVESEPGQGATFILYVPRKAGRV